MVDIVRPSGNALGAPKGSQNYLDKLESYASALEAQVADMYHKHQVITVGAVASIVGFIVGSII